MLARNDFIENVVSNANGLKVCVCVCVGLDGNMCDFIS